MAVWQSEVGVGETLVAAFYRVFDASGAAVTAVQQVSAGPPYAAYVDVAALPQGGFVIGWDNADSNVLEAQLFTNAGVTDGSVFTVETTGVTFTELGVTSDGRVLFTWINNPNGSSGDIVHSIWDPRSAVIDAGDYDTAGRTFVTGISLRPARPVRR